MYTEILGAIYMFAAANVLLLTARAVVAVAQYSQHFIFLVCRLQTKMLKIIFRPLLGLAISYAIVRYVRGPVDHTEL